MYLCKIFVINFDTLYVDMPQTDIWVRGHTVYGCLVIPLVDCSPMGHSFVYRFLNS